MIKRIKRFLTTLSLSSLLIMPVLVPVAVHAQTDCLNNPNAGGINECLNSGTCATDPDACPEGDDATDRVNDIIKLIINIFSLIVGVISVIMIIIGGLKYITSGGNDSNVAGAKNTILYAVIGLVIVALAQVIVRFVLNKVSTNAG
jgi:hypothetical protein